MIKKAINFSFGKAPLNYVPEIIVSAGLAEFQLNDEYSLISNLEVEALKPVCQ